VREVATLDRRDVMLVARVTGSEDSGFACLPED